VHEMKVVSVAEVGSEARSPVPPRDRTERKRLLVGCVRPSASSPTVVPLPTPSPFPPPSPYPPPFSPSVPSVPPHPHPSSSCRHSAADADKSPPMLMQLSQCSKKSTS